MSPSSLQTIAAAALCSPDALYCLDSLHLPVHLQMLLTCKIKERAIPMLMQPEDSKDTELLEFITNPNAQDIDLAVLSIAAILLIRDPEVGTGECAYTNMENVFIYDWSSTSK